MTDFTIRLDFKNPGEASIFEDVIGTYPAIREGALVMNNGSDIVIILKGKPELIPAIFAEVAQCLDAGKPASGRYEWKK